MSPQPKQPTSSTLERLLRALKSTAARQRLRFAPAASDAGGGAAAPPTVVYTPAIAAAAPPPASSAPPQPHTVTQLATSLGFHWDADTQTCSRHHITSGLHTDTPLDGLDDPQRRAQLSAELTALRLAIDTPLAKWTPERERPEAPAQTYQKQEIPSSYGERLPRIVPRSLRLRCEAMLGEPLAWQEVAPDYDSIYVLEIGRTLHALTAANLAALDLSLDRIAADARYMLFYQSYKISAEVQRAPCGIARCYATTEGLGATRAVLLPDLDLDAARARGFASAPSRDLLIVVEPASAEKRDEARAWCHALASEARAHARHPYLTPLFLDLEPAEAH